MFSAVKAKLRSCQARATILGIPLSLGEFPELDLKKITVLAESIV